MDLLGWAGLAATTFIAALLYTVSGFGFAVLAAPLFLLSIDPAQTIQLVIIISTALAVAVLPGLRRAVAPGLLLRLALGSLAGLPLGLLAFRFADPVWVRIGMGVVILAFAALTTILRGSRGRDADSRRLAPLAMTPLRDLTAGVVSGTANALVGMAGPPVLIYLLLAGAAVQTVRATLLAFFALCYGATLIAHAATLGIPGATWVAAGILIPFAFLGGIAGRPIGDRLGPKAFAILAAALLAAAGLYTVIAAGVSLAAHPHQSGAGPSEAVAKPAD